MDQLIESMEAVLPDSKIAKDVLNLVAKEPYNHEIKLGRHRIKVPQDVQVDVITRALFKEYYDIYRDHSYKVQIALGGVSDLGHGILDAGYCFGTLWYNLGGVLVAAEFHKNER